MDSVQMVMGLRALADIIEMYDRNQATREGIARAVEKHCTREFKRIENLEDDLTRKQILQENVNRRLDRERERAAAAAASTSTRKKRQRKKSLLRKVRVWFKRKRYALRKLTRRRRGHADMPRGRGEASRRKGESGWLCADPSRGGCPRRGAAVNLHGVANERGGVSRSWECRKNSLFCGLLRRWFTMCTL